MPTAASPHRLRVLHFGRFHDEGAPGGIERHVATLLRGLSQHVDVTNLVAAPGRQGDVLRADGYPVHRVPSYGVMASTALAPALITEARRLHRAQGFDILHLHFPDPLSHLAALALPHSIPRVVSWHSDVVRQRRLLTLYRPFLSHFMRKVDAVITATPAHFTYSTQLSTVPPVRRHVIPYGLDYDPYDATDLPGRAAALRQAHCGDAPLVLAVGRHVHYKGFEFLLRALVDLPGVFLVLGGNGPLTGELQALAASLGIAQRVHFPGCVPDRELAAWYAACDVFCLPSITVAEAFGLVQLEAMACGKPVVSCRLGTGVDFVNEDGVTGLCVPPGDSGALTRALGRLLADATLRTTLGAQGRQRARTKFSPTAMVAGTLALYHCLAAA